MSATIEFNGYYKNCFRNVSPTDICIKGKNLYIHNISIPIAEKRLFDVFFLLEKECGYKNGKIKFILLKSGDIKYASKVTDDTIAFFVERIFDSWEKYEYLPKKTETVPDDDVYLIGRNLYHL